MWKIPKLLSRGGSIVTMLDCRGHAQGLLFGAGVFLKIILFILLLAVVFVLVAGAMARSFLSALFGLRPNPRGHPSSRSGHFGGGEKAERMLPCAVCGVHVPESEGVKSAGRFFCCEAHRK